MDIKVNSISVELGYICYNITFGEEDIDCAVMFHDIEVGHMKTIPEEVRKIAEEFGVMIKDKLIEANENFLLKYKNKVIGSVDLE